MTPSNIVHVAVAVIKNQHGQFFIAKRPDDSHQGGLWEFPGGKIEKNETVLDALKRELVEEVGITLIQASPLIRIHHEYTDKSVLLDVWCIDKFTGEAYGKEGQKAYWINQGELSLYDFPVANLPIIKALNLPDKYMITGKFSSEKELLIRIQSGLDNGLKLIQFRAYELNENDYFYLARNIFKLCEKYNSKLILNTSFEKYNLYKADKFSHGLHLNSKEIKLYSSNIEYDFLTSTSVHNHEELQLAKDKQVDFAVLSPVKETLSHPESKPLGWENFKLLIERANIPVFALGGMTGNDLKMVKEFGGQGIAAIGEFWNV